MSAKTKFVAINLLGLVLAIIVLVSNSQTVGLKLLGAEIPLSTGTFFLVSYIIGALIGGCSMLPLIAGKQEQNVAKLKEWQAQDAKLAVEVQSDKEKQLEAKIATLEAALKQALKK